MSGVCNINIETNQVTVHCNNGIINMESIHTSTLINISRFSQNLSNDSFGFTKDTPTVNTDYINIAILTLCSLGLPGNLLVIAVYVRNMVSSVRVYMLALAVADSAICIGAIILSTERTNVFAKDAVLYVLNVAVTFSMFLLVFVAIERLTAIFRPYSFNTNPRRAWKALLIIATASVGFATFSILTRETRLQSIRRGIKVCVFIVCVLTITICYIMIAATLLARDKSARTRVSTFYPTASPKPQPSHFQKGIPNITTEDPACRHSQTVSTNTDTLDTVRPFQRTEYVNTPGTSTVTTSASVVPTNTLTAAQTTAYKNVLLLFIITVVFIACWLTYWLYAMSVPIASKLSRLFVVNSVVNPFIYSVASAMFREDVRQFYRQTRVKLSGCYH